MQDWSSGLFVKRTINQGPFRQKDDLSITLTLGNGSFCQEFISQTAMLRRTQSIIPKQEVIVS